MRGSQEFPSPDGGGGAVVRWGSITGGGGGVPGQGGAEGAGELPLPSGSPPRRAASTAGAGGSVSLTSSLNLPPRVRGSLEGPGAFAAAAAAGGGPGGGFTGMRLSQSSGSPVALGASPPGPPHPGDSFNPATAARAPATRPSRKIKGGEEFVVHKGLGALDAELDDRDFDNLPVRLDHYQEQRPTVSTKRSMKSFPRAVKPSLSFGQGGPGAAGGSVQVASPGERADGPAAGPREGVVGTRPSGKVLRGDGGGAAVPALVDVQKLGGGGGTSGAQPASAPAPPLTVGSRARFHEIIADGPGGVRISSTTAAAVASASAAGFRVSNTGGPGGG